jgi:hypothetical protein
MVANAAYFYGLVHGLENLIVSGALPPLERSALSFSQVKENFESAARLGLESQLTWLDGKRWRAVELNLKLIEIAESGLMSLGVPEEQRERYLGVIRERVVSGKTGAQWQLKAFENLRGRFSDEECLAKIACRVFELQNYRDDSDRSLPVARWPDLT